MELPKISTEYPYLKFADVMKHRYGEKVYKLPVNVKGNCPNRDGRVGVNGCIFCGEESAGFETLDKQIPIKEQLSTNMEFIGKKYNARKFIAYFQNWSNTYCSVEVFEKNMREACIKDVVALYVSTRPDCVDDTRMSVLKNIAGEFGVDVTIELGLQTVNYRTLDKLNRGHSLAEYIDAVNRIHRYGFEVCTHLIIDLPHDEMCDVIEAAKIIGALGVEQVKCHSLFFLKDTELGRQYENGEIEPLSMYDFVDRMVTFIEYLPSHICLQRLVGRAPKTRALFCNWETSWWKIQDEIDKKFVERDTWQGKMANYLNGNKTLST